MGTINGMDRQERDEHRSKHKQHRHHRHRPRHRDGNVIQPSGSGHMSPDRCDISLAPSVLFEQASCDRRTACHSSCTVYLGLSFAAVLHTTHNYSWNQPRIGVQSFDQCVPGRSVTWVSRHLPMPASVTMLHSVINSTPFPMAAVVDVALRGLLTAPRHPDMYPCRTTRQWTHSPQMAAQVKPFFLGPFPATTHPPRVKGPTPGMPKRGSRHRCSCLRGMTGVMTGMSQRSSNPQTYMVPSLLNLGRARGRASPGSPQHKRQLSIACLGCPCFQTAAKTKMIYRCLAAQACVQ